MKPYPEIPDPVSEEARPRDALLHAAVARATHGLSPASVALALQDWAIHLATAPGKQYELLQKAQRKLTRLALYLASANSSDCPRCIEPLPQDRRFDDPAWEQWPYNIIYQSFLLTQQWWWNATTGVRGVSAHHEDVVTFMTRQWLDVFSPSNFLPTNPQVLRETWQSSGMNLVRGAQNAWEDAMRLASNRPPVGTENFEVSVNVAVTPGKVIYRNRLIELIQYEPSTPQVHAEPILIVPSWIMKYYVLDLSPQNSLVRFLVASGHTVFMISWKNPDAEDRDLGMDAYVRYGVFDALKAIAAVVPERRVHATGYCLGGTLLAIAAAAREREGGMPFASVSLLASELDFSEPGELGLFIDESQIDFLEDIMWARGYLDSKEMAGAFTLLNSKDLVWSKLVRDYLLGKRAPVTDLAAWNADATRLPYRMHSEYLRRLYLANDLAEGRYRFDGTTTIALSDIRSPMFVVGTERDHVSPWRSVYKAHLLSGGEVTFVLASGGHNVGIVSPPVSEVPDRGYRWTTRAHEAPYLDPDQWFIGASRVAGSWWPQFAAWLAQRTGELTVPPGMGAPLAGLPPLDDAPGSYVRVP